MERQRERPRSETTAEVPAHRVATRRKRGLKLGLIWAGLLAVAFGGGMAFGAWGERLFPPGRLVMVTTPETPFNVMVFDPGKETGQLYDGAREIALPSGDYQVEVRPVSGDLLNRRLKIHLGRGQSLAIPVVLRRAPPKCCFEPSGPY